MTTIIPIEIMNCICIVCRRPIRVEDGLLIAFPAPWNGLAHITCAQRDFKYDLIWPHEFPKAKYVHDAANFLQRILEKR